MCVNEAMFLLHKRQGVLYQLLFLLENPIFHPIGKIRQMWYKGKLGKKSLSTHEKHNVQRVLQHRVPTEGSKPISYNFMLNN